MTMNEDIAKYGVFGLTHTGELVRVPIYSTDDYNHSVMNIHHYIPKGEYKRNKKWYNEHGIKQKLFYIPNWLHEQVENRAIKNLTDSEFEQKFKISRYCFYRSRNKQTQKG